MRKEPRVSTRDWILYLPVFKWKGFRYRSRLRLIGGFKLHQVNDLYPDSPKFSVRRFWIGPFLLTVMIDNG